MNHKIYKVAIWITIVALSGASEVFAQTASSSAQETQPAAQGSTNESATPDPSRGPLQPTPQLPEAPSASQQTSAPAANSSSSKQDQNVETPLGAAAAQAAPTAGGAASKPAGSAIAPAKQRQVRSLLIKIGVIAAAGVAVGTVYGLSRGTPSTPPGFTNTTPSAQAAGQR